MQIEKFESDIFVASTSIGSYYMVVIYIHVDEDRALVKLSVYNNDTNSKRVVTRKGKCIDNKLLTSVNNCPICINLLSGAIIEPIVKCYPDLIQSAKYINDIMIMPQHF